MGRPINKRYLGNPTTPGLQLLLNECWLPGASAPETTDTVYILRQTGSHRYMVTNGTTTGIVTLVGAPITQPGQARLAVTPFGGATEYARTIYDCTVKTFSDNDYSWSTTSATQVGQANLNMA